ncbi:MAG: ABC transporter ATP-binding protein [Rickettsiaceae bacterium]|nr:ABC transporter ATP-binding protein [Rickettsiaceae bacterium]
MVALKIENLVKSYSKSKLALNDINLEIPKGSFFALLGPNGAGKSTLINIIAGIAKKDSGKIDIMGYNFDLENTMAKRQIGIVPQEIMLDSFFTVYEALDIFAGYYGIRPNNRRTDELIDALGLSDKKYTLTRKLSGGMKRRLLVAKAMVHSPKVLILDEPSAGVDIVLREQLWEYLLKLNKEGTTIILTTHYLEEVKRLCDYVSFINKGSIIHTDRKNNLLSTLGYKKITIDTTQQVTHTPNDFKVPNAKFFDNQMEFISHPQKMQTGEIISQVIKLGYEISNITILEPELEDIFKKIINQDNKVSNEL